VLSSNIASLTASMVNKESRQYSKEVLLPVKKSITILKQSLIQLNDESLQEAIVPTIIHPGADKVDKQLTEQLNFIYKVTCDIGKITQQIARKNLMITTL
jgi:hypothetical protein